MSWGVSSLMVLRSSVFMAREVACCIHPPQLTAMVKQFDEWTSRSVARQIASTGRTFYLRLVLAFGFELFLDFVAAKFFAGLRPSLPLRPPLPRRGAVVTGSNIT